MIEKMQAVDLVCLAQDRDLALKELRRLEIIHVRHHEQRGDSDELSRCRKREEELYDCIRALSARKVDAGDFNYSEQTVSLGPAEMSHRVHDLIVALQRSRERLEHWRRAAEHLAPWGDFDPQLVKDLRANGMTVRFCTASVTQALEAPEGALLAEISRDENRVYFVVVSDRPLAGVELPELAVPLDHGMEHIRREIQTAQDEIAAMERELLRLSVFLSTVEKEYARCQEQAEFLETRDRMGASERFTYISGFIPAKREEELRAAARQHGWGLLLSAPAPGDPTVPTLITVPKWLQVSKPIFDFVGIRPGYDEFDISGWFLIFFAIFFAMIIGDAGYGAVFLGLTLLAKAKLGGKFRVQTNLVMLLSIGTLIWGGLNGNWFGLTPEMQQSVFGAVIFRPLPYFDSQALGEMEVYHRTEFLCFLIAAIHLSIAHGWRALLVANHPKALSQVGWIAVIWANFLLANKLVAGAAIAGNVILTFYGIGVALIVFFTAPNWNPLKSIGSGLGSVAGNGVNSFVDVISYIRLFAVGLSSYFVAMNFNEIAGGMFGNPWTFVVGVGVLLFGHALNVALCLLGVLVHGIRLNTLEFSGHMGLEWKGIPFKPFARRLKEKIVQ